MDIAKILNELRAERQLMDEVIAGLERMTSPARNRRGRPPARAAEEISGSRATSSVAEARAIALEVKFPPE
jgi:hypothetical protein